MDTSSCYGNKRERVNNMNGASWRLQLFMNESSVTRPRRTQENNNCLRLRPSCLSPNCDREDDYLRGQYYLAYHHDANYIYEVKMLM